MKSLLIILYLTKAVSTQVVTLAECNAVATTIERTHPNGVRALCIPMGKETP